MITTQHTYGVTLSCYRGATCLTPLVLDRVEAESPQEALDLVMEKHNLLYVASAEVVLPDGAAWQRYHVLYKDAYDVAIWRRDRTAVPILGNQIQADSPLRAALSLMRQEKLNFVARVSVRCPDNSMWRMEHLKLEKEEKTV